MKPVLWIDTSGDPARIGLGRTVRELPNRRQLSGALLREIDALLRADQLSVSDLAGIGVAVGPGTFTGLRIGIAAANALAWSHQLPVVPIPAGITESLADYTADNIKHGRTVPAAVPEYGRPPSITMSAAADRTP